MSQLGIGVVHVATAVRIIGRLLRRPVISESGPIECSR